MELCHRAELPLGEGEETGRWEERGAPFPGGGSPLAGRGRTGAGAGFSTQRLGSRPDQRGRLKTVSIKPGGVFVNWVGM